MPMKITIQSLDDQTPKGLTTGFKLDLQCLAEDGRAFPLTAVILVSKDVVEKQIPLPNLVVAALAKWGLSDDTTELFVDSRRLDLSALSTAEPALPLTIQLGGHDVLNTKTIETLVKKRV
jgi:hypothetical protein